MILPWGKQTMASCQWYYTWAEIMALYDLRNVFGLLIF